MHRKSALVIAALAALAALLCGCGNQKVQLPAELALPDFVVTPDGMAIAPDGDLLLACPNFASPGVPGRFVKIGKDRKVRDLFECPHPSRDRQGLPHGSRIWPARRLVRGRQSELGGRKRA